MQLMTEDEAESIPALYQQENSGDEAKVYMKFFDPCSNWTWYVMEFDGVDSFFGLVVGHETEFGYFSLRELQSYEGPLKIGIERDIWFKPCPLREVQKQLGMRVGL
jgi:hypothetical protein